MRIRTNARVRWAAAVVPLALIASACNGADTDAENTEAADVEAADADARTISFAHSYDTGHPHHRCGVQAVADRLAESGADLTIDVFANSQLGGDTDRFNAVMSGDIDIDLQGTSALAASYSPIGLFDTAYAFDGPDHLFAFFEGEESEQLRTEFEEATGTRILDVWYFGMRHFTANEPIHEPDDLRGQRMRFPDSPVYLANAEALGARATPVAFEEVFLSLQQGVIDGQENPIPTIDEMNFNEVQDYLSLTGHQTGAQLSVVSGETWEALTEEQQGALEAAFEGVREENRACIEQAEEELLDEWRETGQLEIIEPDVDAFRERAVTHFLENLDGVELELFESARAAAE